MVARQRIDRAADTDHVVRPAPFGALDRGPQGERRVDVGEGHDLGLAVVPAPAAEQSDVVGQGLLDADDVAVFDAAGAGLRDVQIERRIVQRLAVASGIGTVDPADGAQFSGQREQ